MYLHLIPTLYCPTDQPKAVLREFSIPEISLTLKANDHLSTCQPFSNNSIFVGQLKFETNPTEGIIIKIAPQLKSFVTISRWKIGNKVSTHMLYNVLIDNEFSSITQKVELWGARQMLDDIWSNRNKTAEAINRFPKMTTSPLEPTNRCIISEYTDKDGFVFFRSELFRLPTVECKRLFSNRDGTAIQPKVYLKQNSMCGVGERGGDSNFYIESVTE